jgi:hydrogenase nickel incorporation protein HypA/HybF
VHELSLCRAVADVVTSHAERRDVTRVTVQVGHLRQVVPDTLVFCWKMVTDGTELAGCELAVEHVPAVGVCRSCGARNELDEPVLRCAACGGRDVVLVSGEELLVASMDLATSD